MSGDTAPRPPCTASSSAAPRIHPTAIVESGAEIGPGSSVWDNVHIRHSTRVGDECIISFRATDLNLWFDSVATVTRVIAGRRPTDRGPAIGLRFDSMDSVHRLILRGHLRKIPPPLPQRDQRIDYAATIFKIAYG